jgi:hypothetical protein
MSRFLYSGSEVSLQVTPLPVVLKTHRRYSILPALSLDGILHLEVSDHSFSGEEFIDFVGGLLDQMQPWPLPNSVLVMDNMSIHKVPRILEMVEEQ